MKNSYNEAWNCCCISPQVKGWHWGGGKVARGCEWTVSAARLWLRKSTEDAVEIKSSNQCSSSSTCTFLFFLLLLIMINHATVRSEFNRVQTQPKFGGELMKIEFCFASFCFPLPEETEECCFMPSKYICIEQIQNYFESKSSVIGKVFQRGLGYHFIAPDNSQENTRVQNVHENTTWHQTASWLKMRTANSGTWTNSNWV